MALGSPSLAVPAQCDEPTVVADAVHTTASRHRTLETWLASHPGDELDRVLLTATEIAQLNLANSRRLGTYQDLVDGAARAPDKVTRELQERFDWLKDRVTSGDYIEGSHGSLRRAARRARESRAVDELRVVSQGTDLHCVPLDGGLYRPPADPDFDRNQCSSVHVGELVRVHRISADGLWRYVHAGHTVGWLRGEVLTPPLPAWRARHFAHRSDHDRLVILDDWVMLSTGHQARMGTSFPLLGRTDDGSYHVLAPTNHGLADAFIEASADVHEGPLPLTRRNVLARVAPRLGETYGWGGMGRGRDCSRLLLDTLALFDVRLGRHSGVQASSGGQVINVAGLDERAKLAAIRAAGRRGVVLLYMPGHIMLYLGEFDGKPFSISAISEYKRPCGADAEQTVRIDRVEVSDLEVGRGTSKTAFIQRISKLAVFGQ